MPSLKADMLLKQVSVRHNKSEEGRGCKSSHLPINATHPIHLMRKVMMESPVETIFSNINNNVDLWIELGYIRVW